MPKENIKPCKKCGGTASKPSAMWVYDEGYAGYICCLSCANFVQTQKDSNWGVAEGEFFQTRYQAIKEVIAKWNKNQS